MGPGEPQKDKMQDDFDLLELSKYWDEDVVDVIVDRGTNDDRELLEMQQIWQLVIAKESSSVHLEGSAQKSILKSPSNFNMHSNSATPVSKK